VRKFARFDPGDGRRVLGMIVAYVVHDLVVILENEVAIRAGMRLGHVVTSWW